MSDSRHRIPEDLKGEIKRRAGYRCEYCKRIPLGENWEVEHVNPRSAGGFDAFDNFAFACKRCNLNKREHTSAIDRVTGLLVPLFNPREDKWENNFRVIDERQVVGRTAIGRATAGLLFRTTSQHSQEDLKWWPITVIRSEPLYYYLNEQRARRLANQFSLLERELNRWETYDIVRGAGPKDQYRAEIAMQFLKMEMCSMRSTETDVRKGISLAKHLLRQRPAPWARMEVYHLLSMLYQQMATIQALSGMLNQAKTSQNQAGHFYDLALSQTEIVQVHEKLRQATVFTKYDGNQLPLYSKEDVHVAVNEAKFGSLKSITYLADAELCLPRRSRHFGRIAASIEDALDACRYGQDFDYARAIVLRRRWWALKLLANDRCDLSRLSNDVTFWKSIKMHNEIRELTWLIERIRQRNGTKVADEMLNVIRS